MIGEKLGRYTIIDRIGTGSMGAVYRAEDSSDGKAVAIKLIRSSVLCDAAKRERFLQGVLAASEVRHSGICPILDIGDDDDDLFVVTPFLQGETLEAALHSRQFHWARSLDIAIAAGEALVAIHAAGTFHRACKPSNIWLRPDNTVVLTDCCVARFTEIGSPAGMHVHSPRVNSADTIIPMSALAYMSPEQIRGDALDFRSDIFSLGVVLYEMLAGHHPFESRNSLSRMSAILEAHPAPPSTRGSNLPIALDTIIARALAKERKERFQSMPEFLNALRMARGSEGQPSNTPVLEPVRIRSAAFQTALVVLGLLIVAVIALAFYRFVLH